MKRCAVCDMILKSNLCDCCGFDASMDCEVVPTLSPVPRWMPSSNKRKRIWQKEQPEMEVCSVCGCADFHFLKDKRILRCARCTATLKLDLAEDAKKIGNSKLVNLSPDDTRRYTLRQIECDPGAESPIWKKAGDMSGSPLAWVGTTRDEDTYRKTFNTSKKNRVPNRIKCVAAGNSYTVALRSDGTLKVSGDCGGKDELVSWTNIIAVAANGRNTACVCDDGTVRITEEKIQMSTHLWSNIADVSVGGIHVVGLTKEGNVLSAGNNAYGQCDLWYWREIKSVVAGGFHTIGLHKDGRVVSTGSNDNGQCNTIWYEIKAIAAGYSHSVGLRGDGTVVAVGDNRYGQCDTEQWTEIVAICACNNHTVGLKKDGTVVATGNNTYGQCNTKSWRGIVAIEAGDWHTVGLKSDGTVVAIGNNGGGQCLTDSLHM